MHIWKGELKMNSEKLMLLKDAVDQIDDEKQKMVKNYDESINAITAKINKLHNEEIKVRKEQEEGVKRIDAKRKDAYAEYEKELAKFDIYGTYLIFSLMPVLTDLTKNIEQEDVYFRTHSYDDQSVGINIDGYKVYYEFDVLTVCGKNWSFPVAESPKPTKISRIYCGDGYADKTYFSKYHKFATYDCTTNAFKFCKLGLHVVEEVPLYIVDFIEYVSNYRYQNDLKEINIDELKRLEYGFLEKYKEQYKGKARKKDR